MTTVADVIRALQKLNPDAECICFDDRHGFCPVDCQFDPYTGYVIIDAQMPPVDGERA